MSVKQIQTSWPVIAVRDMVVFPHSVVAVRIGRAKTIAALLFAQNTGVDAVVVAQQDGQPSEDVVAASLYKMGTVVTIESVRKLKAQSYEVVFRGKERVMIEDYIDDGTMIHAKGTEFLPVSDLDDAVRTALLGSLKGLAIEVLRLLPSDTTALQGLVDKSDDINGLSFLCAAHLEIEMEEKQALLEMSSLKARVLQLLDYLQRQRDLLQLQSDIREKIGAKMGKAHRDAVLRQQMEAIREELGESDDRAASGLSDKIAAARMPEEVEKVAREELQRLERMGSQSPEATVIRNYLDFLCALPWSVAAKAEVNMDSARSILERDHFGLDEIKKRVLQHIAVLKLRKSGNGTLLLLVGPPGVGKTSLGHSVAEALGRKFVRVSLGGVRDDAEIRGHRRTYIGAMAGRILQGIKRAGEKNPVMLLDEIDKMGRGYQGDPAAALLEVLDPEQNRRFSDHYAEVPFDLSEVVFVATANSLESIPAPLLDRMEVIEVSGYTHQEKRQIAIRYLLPKQLQANGLDGASVMWEELAVDKLISDYTREAGVRDLERQLAKVTRAYAERVASGEAGPFSVTPAEVQRILGRERFHHELAQQRSVPGIVTGLAWTPVGGEILFIESSLMEGSGRLILTGQMGEVMRESAQIAQSLIRTHYFDLLPLHGHRKRDLHIHIPSGAIPKDGPSAGIALLTAMASLYSGREVDPRLAMTGEVTLSGQVTAVGGIREKILAAHRAGITKVILSKRNESDLDKIPSEVRSQMEFVLVEHIREVLAAALGLPGRDALSLPAGASAAALHSSS